MIQDAQKTNLNRNEIRIFVRQIEKKFQTIEQAKFASKIQMQKRNVEINLLKQRIKQLKQQFEHESKNENIFSFKFKKKIENKSSKRFFVFIISLILTNEIKFFYDFWKLRIWNKFQNNVDWYHSNNEKITTIIFWIVDTIVKHLNALRLNNHKYFENENMMFDVLNDIFANSNKIRNVKKKYIIFKMKSNQIFAQFYFEFIYLINQLLNYFEKIKMNDLERKITFIFREIIVDCDDFNFLTILQKKFLFVNVKFRHIINDNAKKKQQQKRKFCNQNVNQKNHWNQNVQRQILSIFFRHWKKNVHSYRHSKTNQKHRQCELFWMWKSRSFLNRMQF